MCPSQPVLKMIGGFYLLDSCVYANKRVVGYMGIFLVQYTFIQEYSNVFMF